MLEYPLIGGFRADFLRFRSIASQGMGYYPSAQRTGQCLLHPLNQAPQGASNAAEVSLLCLV